MAPHWRRFVTCAQNTGSLQLPRAAIKVANFGHYRYKSQTLLKFLTAKGTEYAKDVMGHGSPVAPFGGWGGRPQFLHALCGQIKTFLPIRVPKTFARHGQALHP